MEEQTVLIPPKLNTYKIYILDNNGNPSHIYLFNAQNNNHIFSNTEQLYLDKFNPQIIYSEQHVYNDDSVRNIKRKILNETIFENISYEEMYLFAKRNTSFHFPNHFKYLQTKDSGIFKNTLGQMIMNLELVNNDNGIKYLAGLDQEYFSYKDIETKLKLDNTNLDISIPIGHKFSTFHNILFSSNPYSILPSDEPVFKTSIDNTLFTMENSLLLNYGDITNNTLYLCLAENVLQHTNSKNLNQNTIIKHYFPFLNNLNILSIDQLNKNKSKLIDTTKALNKNKDTRIDTLYEVFDTNIDIPYVSNGITDLNIVIHPENKTIIPLENIFKKFHATSDIPFIKYKPGFKKEEIFRLFSNGFSDDGRKKPFLSKIQISQFSKRMIGFQKYISLIKKDIFMENSIYLHIGLTVNGNIYTDIKFPTPVNINIIEKYIITNVNPIITEINKHLQMHNRISLLENINSHLIESNNIVYNCSIKYNNRINDSDLLLLTPVFNIIESSKNISSLRYKRVSNYKEMDEKNALISMYYKQNMNIKNIVSIISLNFNLTEAEAEQDIISYLNEFNLVNGNYINKKMNIADNPGFPTTLEYIDIENRIQFNITNIDSLKYIHNINIFIEAFVKLTQFKDKLNISKQLINSLKKNTQDSIQPNTENIITTDVDIVKEPISGNKETFGYIDQLRNNNNDDDDDDDASGILFDDDDDDDDASGIMFDNEEEEEEEEEAEEEITNTKVVAEIEEDDDDDFFSGGVKGKNSGSYFAKKLQRLEPMFFSTENNDPYATICPAQSNRQPVILTPEEKEEIDNDPEAQKAYGIAVKYGTNPEKPYWYMCPRYWCLKTNKPITEEQVKNGECGGKIIPQNQRNHPPEGHYIYEFTDDRQHLDSNGNYINYNPGFLDKSKSKGEHGIPCCFKTPFSIKQNVRRNELNIKEEDIKYGNSDLIYGEKTDVIKMTRNYLNILENKKILLPQHRWGFLPLSLELFLHTDNSKAVDPTNDSYIKKNESPLLRYGVEKSDRQSFVACIADIYTYHNKIEVPTIKEMRNIIIEKLSLDFYLKVHNGTLVSLFQPKKVNISDIDVEKYRNTDYYKSIDLKKASEYNFLKFTIASYEKFLSFLDNDDSIIDHSYLWDIVCSPEIGLFDRGLNLVIMQIEDNDIRDNVSLICPTNSYSDVLYSNKRGSVLIVKQNEYYQPIYVYGHTKDASSSNKINAVKILYNENIPPKLSSVMTNIEKIISNRCKPQDKPKIYKYKSNLSAKHIYDTLQKHNITVHKQVLNYRGKLIGLMVSSVIENKYQVYIPTRPSVKLNKLEHIFIDDVKWLDYNTTISLLQMINNKTNNEILCRPILKVEEDAMIVGVITETNQFILLYKPEQNLENDDIETLKTTSYINYYTADKSLTTSYNSDKVRELTTRNIKLETNFYLYFRFKLREELTNLMNKEYTDQIKFLSNSKEYVYQLKMKKMVELIKQLLKPHVNFIEFTEDVLDTIYKNNPSDGEGFCVNNENRLCIPIKNLFTNEDNENLYYNRIADEIIRNNRIKLFLFDPSYINFTNVDFDILPNELLLLNSHINDEYFNSLNQGSYIENIPYELAKSTTKIGNNKITLKEQAVLDINSNMSTLNNECVNETNNIVDKNNWNTYFNDHQELVLNNSPLCSYYILAYILKTKAGIEENIYTIKQRLVNAYKKLFKISNYGVIIKMILSKQFKREYINKIKTNQITFENMVMNDYYVITQFDIWVLCNEMNLPVVLFSKDNYKSMNINTNYIILGGNTDLDEFIFIRTNPYKTTDKFMTNYSIITPNIKLNEVKDVIMTKQTMHDYLKNYKVKLVKD